MLVVDTEAIYYIGDVARRSSPDLSDDASNSPPTETTRSVTPRHGGRLARGGSDGRFFDRNGTRKVTGDRCHR